MIIPSAAAGSPAYSEVIFNVQGEHHWHFKDHVRLVIIAIHKLKPIITILRTWFRRDDAFELQPITVIPAEFHLMQTQLLAAE